MITTSVLHKKIIMTKIAIIGDFNPDSRSHHLTNDAIAHSSKLLHNPFSYDWIETEQIDTHFHNITQNYKAFWIAPGGPFKNVEGALRLIEFARLNNRPTLGTCRGFQHMVLEFARNVLHIKEAAHAEYDPKATKPVVSPLTCNIRGQTLEIQIIDPSSKVSSILQTKKIQEKYYCSFGLDYKYQDQIDKNGFKIVGVDDDNQARILELENHPFFIGTLFVPQDSSTEEHPNKFVTAFLKAASTLEFSAQGSN